MNTTITLLNKLKKNDSITGLDIWYKYFIQNVEYTRKDISNIVNSTISKGETFVILLPFTSNFLPYNEWKNVEDKEKIYTISPGDIIILGEEVNEEVTPKNVINIKNSRGNMACEVKSVIEVAQKNGARYRLKLEGI